MVKRMSSSSIATEESKGTPAQKEWGWTDTYGLRTDRSWPPRGHEENTVSPKNS